MEIVNSILGCIVDHTLYPIKVHCGYLKHYDDNIETLERLVSTLEARETDVLKAIKVAKRNGEEILNPVQYWIALVDRVKVEAKMFLNKNVEANKRCFKGWFPNVRTLYKLSREAETKREVIERLCEQQAQFGINVSLTAPPPETDSITSKDFVPFQTTKLAMEKVMDALKEDSTNFVGIHGMGGVGKTTLVKQIGRKCKEERLFDKVVMAVVSQTPSIESIQEQIADFLGLNLEEGSVIVRARRLNNRLKYENKILVILDDVWAKLDLATIGIPSGEDHKGCKVVITTRREQVCTSMGGNVQARRIVYLGVLSKEECWDLLKLQTGDIIESTTVKNVAEKLVKECGGLPIALVTLGQAMRGKDAEEWKRAAQELEESKPVNIEGINQIVFKCIKLSYDYLRDEEAKDCFLLCCLFPNDYNIETETLVRYGVGLNIFKRFDEIQEVRRRAHFIINNLKASSLLVESEIQGCSKMPVVVRSFAREIASGYFAKAGEGLKEWPSEVSTNEYNGNCISLMGNGIRKYPDALQCPNLEMLLMQNNDVEREMREEVFKGMNKLKVLDQSHNSKNRSLEPSFSHLTNLRTLIIDGDAWRRGDSYWLLITGINALGELKTLEVLSLRYCRFEEPLGALRKMRSLRLLDLARSVNCSSLFNFGEDFNFPKLEELYLTEGMSCGVAELMKCCPRLNVLKFVFNDIIQIPHNFDFSHLDRFNIYVGMHNHAFLGDYFENILHINGKYGQLDKVAFPDRIRTLLSRVSNMSLSHFNGLTNTIPYLVVIEDSLVGLEKLEVEECHELEFLISSEQKGKIQQPTCFLNLKELRLWYLRSFRGLCDMVIVDNPDSFFKLKELRIYFCPKMSNIGAPLNLLRRMRQLEVLEIRYCGALEYLFDLKEEVDDAVKEEEGMPKVEDKGIHEVVDAVEDEEGVLAKLTRLDLEWLSNLKELWKGYVGLVYLRNLKTVHVTGCPKLKVLFHWPVAQGLEQLQELTVSRCEELEEIVGRETEGEDVDEALFPKLQCLTMKGLPQLVGFYKGRLLGSKSTPKLKTINMGMSVVEMDGKNLKTVIEDHKVLLLHV